MVVSATSALVEDLEIACSFFKHQ